jgi:hypothetical protein
MLLPQDAEFTSPIEPKWNSFIVVSGYFQLLYAAVSFQEKGRAGCMACRVRACAGTFAQLHDIIITAHAPKIKQKI